MRPTHAVFAAVTLTAVLAGTAGADVFVEEVEPNGSAATSTPLGGSAVRARGHIAPGGDEDYWSFSASGGDRVFAATMTSDSASGSSDSVLDLLASDGTTVIETDDENGTFSGTASSIAGAVLPVSGTYYIRVRAFSAAQQIRPYHFYLQVRQGVPDTEVEPNDVGQVLPPSGWVSGALSSAPDLDTYSMTLAAGDTVFLSLDLDPERNDVLEWNGRLIFGPLAGSAFIVNDNGTSGAPDSEAFFMTIAAAGTYAVTVSAASGFGTYHLSVTVLPRVAEGTNCTTYTSGVVSLPIGDLGTLTSTIVVPGHPRIADLDVSVRLSHTFPADLDVHLLSPADNQNGLFTDVGNAMFPNVNVTLDDEAALPAGTLPMMGDPIGFQPEAAYRLSWFDGEDAGGIWTLLITDDQAGDAGTLQSWSLTVCQPPPPEACPPGHDAVTVYAQDFEAGPAGWTHTGLQDEWQIGLPVAPPITTCHSGTMCMKTDLTGTYDASSIQDLFSPAIDLAAPIVPPIVVSWAHRYQMDSASFDHYFVELSGSIAGSVTRLFEWRDAAMTDTIGSAVMVQESAGWARVERRIDAYAGQMIDLRFHVDSNATVNLAGVAVDDVEVRACVPWGSDVIFKDGFQ